ncbi:MAG: YtxH domain-containing protein [Candidatus Limnocylindria bacterium]
MFSRVRIAIRFFFVGLAVGVLLAPRSGEETRRMLREKADRLLNDVLDAASLGTTATGDRATATASATDLVDEEADAPRTRGSNGGRTTRSRTATSAGAT